MDFQSFYDGMHRMARMWGKALTQDQVDLYFRKLKTVAEKPWRDIVQHALAKCRSFPSREELWAFWLEWQQANSDKMRSDRQEVLCDICNNRGYLDIKYIPKHIREVVAMKEGVSLPPAQLSDPPAKPGVYLLELGLENEIRSQFSNKRRKRVCCHDPM